MQKIIAITGATGKVGGSVAKILLSKGIRVRAAARNSEKLISLKASGADIFPGNLEDTAFLTETFKGSNAVLAVAPDNLHYPDFKENKDIIARSVITAIRNNNIKNVVVISSIGTDLVKGIGPMEALHNMEEQVRNIKDINAVIIRSAYYMENLLTLIPLIKNAGIIGGGFAPEVKLPMVSVNDVARTASEYLYDLNFTGVTVKELLGPKDYTFKEVTSVLGKAIGMADLQYVQFPYNELRNALVQTGFSGKGADAIIESVAAHNEGRVQSTVSRSAENTTGTLIEEFAEKVFAEEYKSEYSKGVVT